MYTNNAAETSRGVCIYIRTFRRGEFSITHCTTVVGTRCVIKANDQYEYYITLKNAHKIKNN